MKLKKSLAFMMSLAMAGSSCYAQLVQNDDMAVTVSAANEKNGIDYEAEVAKNYYIMYYDDEEKTYKEWAELSHFKVKAYTDEITIPAEISNKNVKSFAGNSVDCSNIKSLIIPEGVWKIEDHAICDAKGSLKYITLPDSLIDMSDSQGIKSSDVAVRGNIGSFAEKYAKKNGYKFEGIGDINDDGSFNSADILKMAAYMYGIKELDETEMFRADCDLNSNINIVDFILLKESIINPKISALGASVEGAAAAPDLSSVERNTSKINADGYEKFTAETAGKVLLETEDENGIENTVYSPVSVYMALSMAAECAGTQTQEEIINALCADDIDDLRAENRDIFNSLYFDDYSEYLKIANSLWLNNKWQFEQDTLDTLAEKYYAVSFTKDFADPNVPGEISNWIYRNTSGKIEPEIEIDPQREIMRIINTVTFKEKWMSKFGEATEDTFYLKDGSEIKCDFLHKTTEQPTANIGFADNYMKYSVPMNNNYQMNFILPDENVSVDEIVGNEQTVYDIITDSNIEYAMRKIVFSVPKLNVASKFDLIPTAKKIGIEKAFDASLADFNPVIDYEKNETTAYIDKITHEAKLTIDEEGCEAAAYTMIIMPPSSACPSEEEPVYFELNRPFFYYISDTNGTPVFAGIINDPLKQ